ncbi:ABC transporter permease [Microbacterium sp. NPDC096154]|uniref:ABC transporter permease n=1 Tax=Microbacterium sp. NPDC096154 TaxID=3155549 RepID=UPI003320B20F
MTTAAIGVPRRASWTLAGRRLIALIVILGLWQLATAVGLGPSMVPSPIEVVLAIGEVLVAPSFWQGLGQTVFAALIGWLIATVLGVVLGLFFGANRFVDRSTSLIVDFGRAFPIMALMPVMILLLGQSVNMKVTMIVLGAVWPVLVQSILGSRRLDAGIVDTAKIYRIPRALWFRRVLLPSALPFIATGVRIAASIAILTAVGVEVLTQVPGLGRLITLAQENGRWDHTFAYLFFAGMFGWGVAALLQYAEKHLLAWNRQSDD